MTPDIRIGSRIAMVEARMASLRSGVGRGGGRVGSGMDRAISLAEQSSTRPPPSASVSGQRGPAALPTRPYPSSVAPPAGTVPAWADRVPAAGRPWAPAIAEAARRHGIDERLLAALVWTESGFDPEARSSAGAIGLGQLMPGTAADLGVDPTDATQNLDGAARYLRDQLDRFGDVRLALAAYNAGPARVEAAGGVPAIEETTTYVARVTGRLTALGG